MMIGIEIMSRPATVCLVTVIALIALVLLVWASGARIGDLTWQGWLALLLGVLGTAGLGGGLMSLIFFSDSSGYDARAGERREGPDDSEESG
jgi:hypothetical protein